MNPQEFTALQVMVLVRTHQGGGPEVREFFDSTPFQYQFQDALGKLIKEQLGEARVEFNEVIISFDAPAQKAEKIQKKSSFMGRLFGGD